MNSTENGKKQAATEAMKYIKDYSVIGVGTGTTVNYFIHELGTIKGQIEYTVSSSIATTKLLLQQGIPVLELNSSGDLDIYVDGADEANNHRNLVKGGGGALTREKIIASSSKEFICIIDETKLVKKLGKFPVAVEVIPMARSYVARELVKIGGVPEWRHNFETDNGNWILDVYNLDLSNSLAIESDIDSIAGVVCNGIFARRPADKLIVGHNDGVKII